MNNSKYEVGQPITVLASCDLFYPSIKNPNNYKKSEKPLLGWFVDGDDTTVTIMTVDDGRYWQTQLDSIRNYMETK